MQACPAVEMTWDERCPATETRQCYEYLANDQADPDPSEEADAATYVITGGIVVVAMIAGYALLRQLCAHSSDPKCLEALED